VLKGLWGGVWQQAMLQAGLIVAGWDKYDGGSVYGIPLGGTLISKLPFAIGMNTLNFLSRPA
jgi:20S proteasome subunit beta 1